MDNVKKQFGHIMVDIEAFGKDSGAAIVSIGAVEFNMNNGEIGNEFYINVDLQSCLDIGLEVDASTIMWWMLQSEDARKALVSSPAHIVKALHEFSFFIESCGGKGCEIWGNSARFDLGILSDAYKKIELSIPWDFRKERDVRTLVSLHPVIKDMTKRVGVAHSAIDDCLHQIKYCSEIWNKIKGLD